MRLLRTFLSDRHVASVAPTRRKCIAEILDGLPCGQMEQVIEFGSGTGAFTKELLRHLPSGARLLAFDTNAALCRELSRLIQDTRLTVIHRSALEAKHVAYANNMRRASLIVSGVPLSFLSAPERRALFAQVQELLEPSGRFLLYQAAWTPHANNTQILREIGSCFHVAHVQYFLLNLPPLVVFTLLLKKPETLH